jgi:hypothetical protein
MSDIPGAREILAQLAPHLAPEHRAVVEMVLPMLHRRRVAKPRAPERSAPVDAETAEAMRAFVRAHPRMSLQEVAAKFSTNPGRVSEALHYDR